MSSSQPATFTLTDAEAAAIQSAQMARQVRITRKSPFLVISSIAAPVIVIGTAWAVDRIGFGGTMPSWLSFTLLAVFIAGMFFMAVGYWLNLFAAKRRLRRMTRQVFEPRTVAILPEGIEQALPTSRLLTLWVGIDAAEARRGIILAWAGNVLAAAVPERAFPSPAAAAAFLTEIRGRISGTQRQPAA